MTDDECLCDWTPFANRVHPNCPFHIPSVQNLACQGLPANVDTAPARGNASNE